MPSQRAESAGRQPEFDAFVADGFFGEVAQAHRPADLGAEIHRLIDPTCAEETIHWGRNYLYRTSLATPRGPLAVVVKTFRTQGLWNRLRRRLVGSKAKRSWRAACAFQAAGIDTASPILLIESSDLGSPSYFISRYLDHTIEARYLLRAVNAGREQEEFPQVDVRRFLSTLGKTLRRMHEAGLFHRDLSIGNVLLDTHNPERLYIIDLNRSRQRRKLHLLQRTRDLCRLAIFKPEHQNLFLRAYWGESDLTVARVVLYKLYHHGFLFKIASKKKWRGTTRRLRDRILPRGTHAHIPEAPDDASVRDKIVWDHLSDQPHQHAGRLEKTWIRLRDTGSHLRQAGIFGAAAPRIWRRYRELQRTLYQEPVPWQGLGVCLRPFPEANEELLQAVEDLGCRHVLIRLHPWEECYEAEEELAAELVRRGHELAFAVPQNRDLVRQPERWQAEIEEIAARFTPYGRAFQIGQAINRSKWGIWTYREYVELVNRAASVLRRYPEIEILGPAVIDFEYQATAAVLNLPTLETSFDAAASLLYVDRRGAPENRQLGFDTVDKVLLMQAIADTARFCKPRSWITEVNWPLWEGPHSPAGRSVSVEEDVQANYLARYYLLALATGAVERVYWWQLIARGYGLIAPYEDHRLRRRPSFDALATLEKMLRGTTFIAALPAPTRTYLFHFRGGSEERETIVGWCVEGAVEVSLPRPISAIIEQDGRRLAASGSDATLGQAVRYFQLENG